MSNPLPNANVPQIPQPMADVGSLAFCAQQIKQGLDSLAGHRGSVLDRAVTFRDLISLKLIAATTVSGTSSTTVVTQPNSVVTPYVISGFMPSLMTPNQVIFGHQFPVKVSFMASFGPISSGLYSDMGAFIAAAGSPVFNIQRCPAASDPTVAGNWTTVGTATFASHSATLHSTADVVFSTSDFMRVVAPAVPDPTLTQLFMCLVGKR